jgi:hypothetical protein
LAEEHGGFWIDERIIVDAGEAFTAAALQHQHAPGIVARPVSGAFKDRGAGYTTVGQFTD